MKLVEKNGLYAIRRRNLFFQRTYLDIQGGNYWWFDQTYCNRYAWGTEEQCLAAWERWKARKNRNERVVRRLK